MKTNEQQKVLVAYFSRADENYNVGYIDKGNTQIVAEMIAQQIGGDLFHIEREQPYPAQYDPCIAEAKREMQAGARPAIKGDAAVEDYDIIFLGYPNWWGDVPMAVYTFIEQHDWQGKKVIPFCTHEGSGLGATTRQLASALNGATLLQGLAVQGKTAQHSQDNARRSVEQWLEQLDY